MNKYYLGIDLGSTTSKAVIIDEKDHIIGRGITNTRANYEVAAGIAKMDAIYNARFTLLKRKLKEEVSSFRKFKQYIEELEDVFQYLQFKARADKLHDQLLKTAGDFLEGSKIEKCKEAVNTIFTRIIPEIRKKFVEGDLGSKSEFFRDIIGEKYTRQVEQYPKDAYESLMTIFDKSITPVENEMIRFDFKELVDKGMEILDEKYRGMSKQAQKDNSVLFDAELNLLEGDYKQVTETLSGHIDRIAQMEIEVDNMVGTGYGRALLPFPNDCIRSEILCHAFGAHHVFPNTRTVLDIGGQDTKAIQVNNRGLVTNFHMNDRCAAGCGRYLGYIADELNISLNELGPLALNSTKEVTICSTCTVFAGAELRENLNLGRKREDILSGLHKAIVMRAMSLLARSGGVKNEFTFTGGVARNSAMLKYVENLVRENYGEDLKVNIHPDSIFMGALGGAMFARRNIRVDLPEKEKSKRRKTAKSI